ncbi:hypothetical protein NSQ45_14765 [Caldifermentibacillus hisashii]|uniref:hypothetical protein n=1 Tax=Caldifermentibacillus hisashii TaxID=996558 RepID=UPI0034D48F32
MIVVINRSEKSTAANLLSKQLYKAENKIPLFTWMITLLKEQALSAGRRTIIQENGTMPLQHIA